MRCDACKKREATFHTVTTVNGKRADIYLCEPCHRMISEERNNEIGGNVYSDFDARSKNATKKRQCQKCGTTLDDFLSSGYLGCEHCYEEFYDALLPKIAQMQQGTQHTGKNPIKKGETAASEYERLNAELKKAAQIEDYERAAILQAQMRQLRENS